MNGAEFLLDNQLKTEAIFTEALQRAQARGEVSDKQDPVALARFFVATIQGHAGDGQAPSGP